MNSFDERLARLAELQPDELMALEQEMVAAFDSADASGDVNEMQAIAAGLDQVRSMIASREDQAPAEETEPAVAASVEAETQTEPAAQTEPPAEPSNPENPPAAPGSEPVPTDPTDPEAPAPDQDAPVDPEATAVPVAQEPAPETTDPIEGDPAVETGDEPQAPAEGDAPAEPSDQVIQEEGAVEVTNADVPEGNQPVIASVAPNYTITAGGDIPGFTAGAEIADMDNVVDAMVKRIDTLRGVSGDNEPVVVASFRRDLEEIYGDERVLRRGDNSGNSRKIREYTRDNHTLESLTAAGWCAPKTPLYDIPGIGTTDTPVADSMASFGVDRGGIIWTVPPALGDLSTQLANLGFWKNTADEGDTAVWEFVPGVLANGTPAADKPCIDIPCGIEVSAELMAIPLCLCFDNLTVRANPELVKATTDLIMVGQARFKEQWLLAQMFGATGVINNHGGGVVGTPDTALGAARDFLVTARLAAAQFRWRNRLAADEQLLIYVPNWLNDAIASDLMVQMPGDGTMSVGRSEVAAYLADCNLTPIWYIDDVPAGVGTAAVAATSAFDSYHGYPVAAEWLITMPGVFTRLDGGELNLGVVRTKEDVQKNKYCEFAETFEAVAYMGPRDTARAWALRGTTPITIRGGFAPAVATLTNMVAE